MLKTKTKYRNETIFFVLMALICFMLFCFGKKNVLAAKNGKVNLDAWNLTDMKKSGGATTTNADDAVEATLDYNSSVENAFKDIVIPTAADFRNDYPNLEKVWISKNAMQSVASNANKKDGSLKISDTDGSKIFAMDDDWSDTFLSNTLITSIDLSGLDTRNVEDMEGMFANCSNLTSIDLSGLDTRNVEDMDGMFANCSNLTSVDLSGWDTGNVEDMDGMFANCSNLTSVDLSGLATGKVENMDGMFYGCRSLSVIDLSGWDTTLTDSAEMFKVESRTPLLVITDNDFFENYDYDSDNRTLFTTTLKVDGKNVVFRVNKDEENVSYNADKTTKYINIYTTYTTTDTKEKILQRLAKRLEKEKNNLIVANGYSNLEWQPVDDYDDKVGYSLAGTYVISFDGGETENNSSNNNTSGHDWSTIENSGGSSGGGSSSSSTNQDLISKNESTDIKTPAPIKSEIPEKLRTRKYLKGYDDEKIKPENYVTNAEFATVIYRLMNDGEEINYDKLKDFGVEKWDWFAEAVAYLIDDSRQIIKVTDEKFNPNKNITGYEMLNIIHNVLKFYGADKSLMNNQDLNSHVTRTKMSEIIFNAFERKNNPGQKIYSDLNDQHWAYKYLMDASE